jgi:hypothetical protein
MQYYLGQSDYKSSSYCLLCAAAVSQAADAVDEEEKQDKVANINRCWIKYAISLMNESPSIGASKATASGGAAGGGGGGAAAAAGSGAAAGADTSGAPLNFGVQVEESARAAVPTEAPKNFAEAKAIFQLGQR